MSTTLPDLQKSASCLPEELLASTVFLLAQLGIAIKARVIREFEEARRLQPDA